MFLGFNHVSFPIFTGNFRNFWIVEHQRYCDYWYIGLLGGNFICGVGCCDFSAELFVVLGIFDYCL